MLVNQSGLIYHNLLSTSIGQKPRSNNIGGSTFTTDSGDPVVSSGGRFTGAYDFDGNDSVSDLSLQLPNTAHTVEWWQYDTGSSAIRRWITNETDSFSSSSWVIREDGSGGIWCYLGSANLRVAVPNIATNSKNSQAHWAISFDGTFVKVYLNKVLQGTSSGGAMSAKKLGLYLGGRFNASEYFVGKQSNLKIWNFAKTNFNDNSVESYNYKLKSKRRRR